MQTKTHVCILPHQGYWEEYVGSGPKPGPEHLEMVTVIGAQGEDYLLLEYSGLGYSQCYFRPIGEVLLAIEVSIIITDLPLHIPHPVLN